MDRDKIIEPIGYIIAAVAALFSLIFFYRDTGTFFGSLAAALLAAGLTWITYVILRLVLLAIRKKN